MGKVKIGLICVSLEGEHTELAQKFLREARQALEAAGVGVVNPRDPVTLDGGQVAAQCRAA